MEVFLVLVGAYIGFGLLLCALLSLRKRKSEKATKAIDMLGIGDLGFLVGLILWPLWVIVQLVEERQNDEAQDKHKSAVQPDLRELVGRIGETVTPVRCSGAIELDTRFYDVTSEEIIEKGTRVEVIGTSFRSLKIKKL